MQIKQLEKAVGLPLFEQKNKRIFLTDAGQQTLSYAKNILQELAELDYAINELKGIRRGHLRLAVANSLSNLGARLVGEFMRLHPEIDITLEVGSRQNQVENLVENQVDLAIMGQSPKQLNVHSEVILVTHILVVASINHPLRQQRNIPLQQLSKEKFIYGEPGSGTRVALDRSLRAQQIDKSHIEVSNNEVVKHCVQQGIGIGLLPELAVETELKYGLMTSLDVQGFPILYPINLIAPANRRLSLLAQEFKKFILQSYRQQGCKNAPHGL
jgi:DNA-binding transcriptional LysR family regulator